MVALIIMHKVLIFEKSPQKLKKKKQAKLMCFLS